MLIPFDKIDAQARVWIYQLNRALGEKEIEYVEKLVSAFCQGWQAHGVPLATSYAIFYNQFLVLAVDEKSSGVSGCSIDGSVHVLKQIEAQFDVNFFDRTLIALLEDDRVILSPLSKLKEMLANGTIKPTTITFNNLVASKEEMTKNWKQPIQVSWLSKYLPKKALA